MNWALFSTFAIIVAYIFLSYKLISLNRRFNAMFDTFIGLAQLVSALSAVVKMSSEYNKKHSKFNSACLQYCLIETRLCLLYHRGQMIANEQFESVKDIDATIKEIENLISTKINEQ